MTYSEIYFFVEGLDDERFIRMIVASLIDKKHRCSLHQYSGMSKKKIKDFLNSIKAMNYADYFFLRDINSSSCITKKKSDLRDVYTNRLDENRIIVVIKEIESWYLAGLDDKKCKELGIKPFRDTDSITKEQFNDIIPPKFDSRIDFMAEVLKRFSIETAKSKNKSFQYFMEKLQTISEEV